MLKIADFYCDNEGTVCDTRPCIVSKFYLAILGEVDLKIRDMFAKYKITRFDSDLLLQLGRSNTISHFIGATRTNSF